MNEKAEELLEVFGLADEKDYISANLPYGKQRKLEIAEERLRHLRSCFCWTNRLPA